MGDLCLFYACALGARVLHTPAETRRGRQRAVRRRPTASSNRGKMSLCVAGADQNRLLRRPVPPSVAQTRRSEGPQIKVRPRRGWNSQAHEGFPGKFESSNGSYVGNGSHALYTITVGLGLGRQCIQRVARLEGLLGTKWGITPISHRACSGTHILSPQTAQHRGVCACCVTVW